MEVALTVRPALASDRPAISNLIHFEPYVHRHLDWRMPLDWLGSPFYWVAEANGRVAAAFCCSPDPGTIAWLRLFACSERVDVDTAWQLLWQTARGELASLPGGQAAAIVTHEWIARRLEASGFLHSQDIIVLDARVESASEAQPSDGFVIRPMIPADLPFVAEVDAAAFTPLWQNSLATLEHAFQLAGITSVAQVGEDVIGYQITTIHSGNAHLARLAVRPTAQRRRVGYALVREMLDHAAARGISRVTVNTQSDNDASLALYRHLGFEATGERYAVFSRSFP